MEFILRYKANLLGRKILPRENGNGKEILCLEEKEKKTDAQIKAVCKRDVIKTTTLFVEHLRMKNVLREIDQKYTHLLNLYWFVIN